MQEPLFQVVFLYLLYVGIISLLFWLIRKVLKNKTIVLVYILVLVSPAFLYIPVELSTLLYGKEFKDVEIDTGFNEPAIYYKVFSISDKEAKLFYVEGKDGKHNVGNFYYYIKVDGKWKYCGWDTVWTNLGGSASEFTIPPYF